MRFSLKTIFVFLFPVFFITFVSADTNIIQEQIKISPEGSVPSQSITASTQENFSAPPALKIPAVEEVKSNYTFLFAAIGNTRTYWNIYSKLAAQLIDYHPDLVFHTGGVVDNPVNDNEWLMFKKYSGSLLKESLYYCVPSYSDLYSRELYRIFNAQDNRLHYTVNYKNSRFFIVNGHNLEEGDEQYEWLTAELNKQGDELFRFLILHFPLYSSGQNGPKKELTNLLEPLINDSDIDMVISGGEGDYERIVKQGVHYIITGGGGGVLHPAGEKDPDSVSFKSTPHFCLIRITNGSIQLEVIDEKGSMIDSFGKTKKED